MAGNQEGGDLNEHDPEGIDDEEGDREELPVEELEFVDVYAEGA